MVEPLLVRSMHGLGDNIHHRAVVRQLMERRKVYLETVWPSLFLDLVGDNLILVPQETKLRTQAANARREAAHYSAERAPDGTPVMELTYSIEALQKSTLVSAMLTRCGCDPERADFSLPIQPAWARRAEGLIRSWRPKKPILVYRPLVERTEWEGCAIRNPDHEAYATFIEAIASEFFIVSVADLVPGVEELAGRPIRADVTLHAGELDIGTLAAVMARAGMVYGSPGFALVMGLAVGTPTMAVFGGFECAQIWADSAVHAPFLGINPRNPCRCLRTDHACQKDIDVAGALPEVRRFAAMARSGKPSGARPSTLIPVEPGPVDRFMNPGEIETILALLRDVRPKVVVEIGVNAGRTANAILGAIPTIERYIGIDVPPGFVTTLAVQRTEVDAAPGHLVSDRRFELMTPPHGSADLTALPACDAVFIDGGHDRTAVLHDSALARAAVRPGGIIIWHDDFGDTVEVRATLDEMYAFGEAIPTHVDGTWLAFQRIGGGDARHATDRRQSRRVARFDHARDGEGRTQHSGRLAGQQAAALDP